MTAGPAGMTFFWVAASNAPRNTPNVHRQFTVTSSGQSEKVTKVGAMLFEGTQASDMSLPLLSFRVRRQGLVLRFTGSLGALPLEGTDAVLSGTLVLTKELLYRTKCDVKILSGF